MGLNLCVCAENWQFGDQHLAGQATYREQEKGAEKTGPGEAPDV